MPLQPGQPLPRFVTALIREQVYGQSFKPMSLETKLNQTTRLGRISQPCPRPCIVEVTPPSSKEHRPRQTSHYPFNWQWRTLCSHRQMGMKSYARFPTLNSQPQRPHAYVIPTYSPDYIKLSGRIEISSSMICAVPWNGTDYRRLHEHRITNLSLNRTFYRYVNIAETSISGGSQTHLTRLTLKPVAGTSLAPGIAWSKISAICIPHIRAVVAETP